MKPSRSDFCHPYHPYDIQLQFMKNLYECIENGQVGILESPTGTGKSLSLICSSLTWLRDHKRGSLDRAVEAATDSDGPDWLLEAERNQIRGDLTRQRLELEDALNVIRAKEDLRAGNGGTRPKPDKRQRRKEPSRKPDQDAQEAEYLLEEYLSDEDKQCQDLTSTQTLSDRTQALIDMLKGNSTPDDGEAIPDEVKVIFCSRTHSQLSQFVNELRKVTPPPSFIDQEPQDLDRDLVVERVKHLSLGSRKNLCINETVSRLSSTIAINEKCLELQKPGTAKERKCTYIPSRDNRELLQVFRNRSLARIRDIEDLGKLGHELEICPYYASRSAIGPAEVLTLPYPLLLQKSAREAIGVSVKNNVVVIDEAHNLMDAIADTFSMSLSLGLLELATSQITAYVQKFKNKLKGKNRVYVTQVIRLINSITDCLQRFKASKRNEAILGAAELMAGKGVDQIRPHKLVQYLQESKLANKVDAYTESGQTDEDLSRGKGTLMHLQNFLIVLMNASNEGRFFAGTSDGHVTVRYLLLDPREHFREIVEEAHAVILAGGTMSPMSDYADYLFSYVETSRLQTYSFGHVIPRGNLCAQAIVSGPSDVEFDFTYEKRGSNRMITELGQTLLRTCSLVPDGVVVFFPSYDYLNQVVQVWKRPEGGDDVFSSLSRTKRVFQESKTAAVEELLRDYTDAVDTGHGALMLSVVGGKLSEGINFSDKLGRAVIAVGLPFPNINGAEWKAKIQYVEQAKHTQLKRQAQLSEDQLKSQAKAAGRDFYENACMRAVNQCIGRAIRHQNDYAAIILVDRRYATDRIHGKLPSWISESMDKRSRHLSWKDVEMKLQHFFADKS